MAERTAWSGPDVLVRTAAFVLVALPLSRALRTWTDWQYEVVTVVSIALGLLAAELVSRAWQRRSGRRRRVR
jgi:hypothetical protein